MRKLTQNNRLITVNPTLAKEWHPTKNGSLLPTDVTAASGKKVWWLCARGHEWEAYIYSRHGSGSGCPFCAGQKASPDHCLATRYPLLAKEWHPVKNGSLLPTDVTPKSGRKVWWLCKKGHEWEATISNRSRLGRGCPFCSGRRFTPENSLAITDPRLAKQWHPIKNGDLTPHDVLRGANKKVWWLCEKGHEWEDSVKNRSGSKSCPYCYGKRISDDNCLAKRNPSLAKEWHPTRNKGLLPKDVTVSSMKRVWWLCKKGHEWQTSINNRGRGKGCPFCANQRVSADNCLAKKNPTLAKEWHPTKNGGLTPYVVLSSSNRKVWWKCNQGHEWVASINNRNKRGKGRRCPFCHSQTSQLELRLYCELKQIFQDVKNREKVFGYELDAFIPSIQLGIEVDGLRWHRERLVTDRQKLISLRQLGIEVVRVREEGLPQLTDLEVVFKRRDDDLVIVHKVLRKILEIHQPQDALRYLIENYIRQNKIMNNAEYMELLNTLPAPLTGNSLQEVNPLLAQQWHPTKNGSLLPRHVSAGSEKKVWWLCEKGHEWEAVVYSRNNGSGCPRCSYEKRGLARMRRATIRN
jgi:very-short-patch-repair endonuclease